VPSRNARVVLGWTVAGMAMLWSVAGRADTPVDGPDDPASHDELDSRAAKVDMLSAIAARPGDPLAEDERRAGAPGRAKRGTGRFAKPGRSDRMMDGPARHGPHGPRERMLGEGEIDQAMTFLKEHWPERHTLLDHLRLEDPEAFALALRNIWPQLARLVELSQDNPELAKAEVEMVKLEAKILRAARALHMKARQAGVDLPENAAGLNELPDEFKTSVSDLKELLGQRFDLQIKRSELRIQELANQLAQYRQRLESQRQDKSEEVNHMLDRLLKRRAGFKRHRGIRGRGPGAWLHGRHGGLAPQSSQPTAPPPPPPPPPPGESRPETPPGQ
jgi:hypothetical protein